MAGKKDAKLAQKLGQLRSFPRRSAWANLRILGQPNTLLAEGVRPLLPARHGPGPPGAVTRPTSALRTLRSKSVLHGAFVWARKVPNKQPENGGFRPLMLLLVWSTI